MKPANFYQDAEKKSVLYAMTETDGVSPTGVSLMEPNTVEAAVEKHIPVLSFADGKLIVRVGETPHPMLAEHYIEWIFVRTATGGMFRKLRPGDKPEVSFEVEESEVGGVYAYCNLHGLWEANADNYSFEQTACSMEFSEGCVE